MGYKLQFSPNFNTEEFERSFNLFYLSLHPHLSSNKAKTKSFFGNEEEEPYKKDTSKVKNIVIYDIDKQSQSLLFEKVKSTEVITHFLYETNFDRRDKEIEFNKTSSYIKNNKEIEEREMLNILIVCQLDQETDTRKIWSFDKYGKNAKLITTIKENAEWQWDIYNQKIRIIERDAQQASIQDFNF